MTEIMVTRGNIDQALDAIQNEIAQSQVALVTIQPGNTGKWSMSRLWRAWMATTAQWMASNGATMPLGPLESTRQDGSRHFNQDDAHELFTALHGYTDKDGERLSWSRAGRDGMRPATKGERVAMLMRHEAWCSERGIMLINPRDSEYKKLLNEQEKC